ncbi:MAG TPA: hypothetical protein VLV45_07590 [Gemmatimonadales bacterium]|nr:hypothetical protein [Gemmatimonadales bacterium]
MHTSSRAAPAVAALSLSALFLLGCNVGPSAQAKAASDSLAQVTMDNARLMQAVAENSRLMTDISRDLARVHVPARHIKVTAESPMQASRDSLLQRIHYVTSRLSELEPKVKENEQRILALTALSDSLRTQLAQTTQSMQGVIDNQKETITSLTDQVQQLTAENAALKDTITNMATVSNTVYYVVGTRDELKQKGIVREEGGARFLFVLWKSGKTLVPARELDPKQFNTADGRVLETLELPASGHEYRIVSRQDVSALATPPADNGTVSGQLKIADSRKFWANSKFLIIVES